MSTTRRRSAASRPTATAPSPAADGTRVPFWPSFDALTDPRGPYLVPILLLLAARLVAWVRIPIAAEDAYITYRFAKNLAVGNGLVYNPGAPIMGFSSPLWTVWNALGYLLLHDPMVWSRAWTILADAVTLVTLGGLLHRHVSRGAAWCFTFFFACWPYFAAVAASGMENSVVVCLIAVSAALAGARSPATGPALAALACARPEGLVAAAIIALGARGRDRLVAAGLTGAAYAAIGLYFGTLIPQSVLAKAQVYGTSGPWAGRVWWEWLSPVMFGRFPGVGDTSSLIVFTLVAAPAFIAGARTLWAQRRTPLALAAAAALAVWAGYAALGVTYFWWYLVVPLVGVAVVVAVGFAQVVRGRGVAVAAMLFVVSAWSIMVNLYLGRAINEARAFGGAADYLVRAARPGEKVMLEPIGLIGYTTPLIVVDEVGLVSPQVAKRRQAGAGWYTDVVRDERPQWLVIRRGVLRTGLAFAGAGAPFRNTAERDTLLARYTMPRPEDANASDTDIVILRRTR